jgi:hypothetical protein
LTGPNPFDQQIPITNAAFERFGKKQNVTLVTPSIAHAAAPIPLKTQAFQQKETHFARSQK